jgi:hypothetical protein
MSGFGGCFRSNADLFASTLIAKLVNKGYVQKTDAEPACELVASKLEDEEDAGTVSFLAPPNWPEDIEK